MNPRSQVDVKGEVRGGRPVDLPDCRLAVCCSKCHSVDLPRRDGRAAGIGGYSRDQLDRMVCAMLMLLKSRLHDALMPFNNAQRSGVGNHMQMLVASRL